MNNTKISLKKVTLYIFLGVLILTLAGCASQPGTSGYWPWFFTGIWHWICAPFALIGSIFTDIRIYEFPNTWRWYDFGFMIWLGLLWGWWGAAAANS